MHLRRLIQTQNNLLWKYFEIKLNKSWTRLRNWFYFWFKIPWIPNVFIIYVMFTNVPSGCSYFLWLFMLNFKNICFQDCIQEIVYLKTQILITNLIWVIWLLTLFLLKDTKIVSCISMKLRKYRFLIIWSLYGKWKSELRGLIWEKH